VFVLGRTYSFALIQIHLIRMVPGAVVGPAAEKATEKQDHEFETIFSLSLFLSLFLLACKTQARTI
jgi:hypothetical protein